MTSDLEPIPVTWRSVASSTVHQVGLTDGGMIVQFKESGYYCYLGVSRQQAMAMALAPSPGRYLNDRIKPYFEARRMTPEEVARLYDKEGDMPPAGRVGRRTPPPPESKFKPTSKTIEYLDLSLIGLQGKAFRTNLGTLLFKFECGDNEFFTVTDLEGFLKAASELAIIDEAVAMEMN